MRGFFARLFWASWRTLPIRARAKIKLLTGVSPYPDLGTLPELEPADSPLSIHFGTIVGAHRASNMLEPALAKFLTGRGHEVTVLLCDRIMPACLVCSIWRSSPEEQRRDTLNRDPEDQGLCDTCFPAARRIWESAGAKIYTMSDLITEDRRMEIHQAAAKQDVGSKVVYEGIDITEDVTAGALRYLCKGDEEKISREVYQRYAQAAMMVAESYNVLLSTQKIDCGIWVHGIYVPHGVVNKCFRAKRVPFLNYNTSYRESRFYFVENETYHHVFPNETADELGLDRIAEEEIIEIEDYLASRALGTNDWQQFNNKPLANTLKALEELGFAQDDRSVAVMYTNVVWDARLHFKDSVYSRMEDWISDTLDYFRNDPTRKLIIRVHPGELISHSVSRSRVKDLPELVDLPENVTIVDAESKISSYDLAEMADLILVYATKMAMELGRYGKPIICSGDAWVRGKGATIDPSGVEDYISKLSSRDWSRLYDESMRRRALAYSYYIFEKKPVAFPIFDVAADRKTFSLNVEKLKAEASFANSSLFTFERMVKATTNSLSGE